MGLSFLSDEYNYSGSVILIELRGTILSLILNSGFVNFDIKTFSKSLD